MGGDRRGEFGDVVEEEGTERNATESMQMEKGGTKTLKHHQHLLHHRAADDGGPECDDNDDDDSVSGPTDIAREPVDDDDDERQRESERVSASTTGALPGDRPNERPGPGPGLALHQLLLGTLRADDVLLVGDETAANQRRLADGTDEAIVVPVAILERDETRTADAYGTEDRKGVRVGCAGATLRLRTHR